jgi:uncharacterized protein (DUF2164 family)
MWKLCLVIKRKKNYLLKKLKIYLYRTENIYIYQFDVEIAFYIFLTSHLCLS